MNEEMNNSNCCLTVMSICDICYSWGQVGYFSLYCYYFVNVPGLIHTNEHCSRLAVIMENCLWSTWYNSTVTFHIFMNFNERCS